MKNNRHLLLLTAALMFFSNPSAARMNFREDVNFDVRIGLNEGAVTPVPLPVEIRRLTSYDILFEPTLDAGARYDFSGNFGVRAGLRLEIKDMVGGADVKNYSMVITGDDGNEISGYWTGIVDTDVRGLMLTIPIDASFKVSDRVRLTAGPYVSFVLNRKFAGQVYDGYLREGSPVGDKIAFYDGAYSDYDFTQHMRKTQVGVAAGIDCDVATSFLFSAALRWGLNGVFKDSFETITFPMFPVYLNIGFGYKF